MTFSSAWYPALHTSTLLIWKFIALIIMWAAPSFHVLVLLSSIMFLLFKSAMFVYNLTWWPQVHRIHFYISLHFPCFRLLLVLLYLLLLPWWPLCDFVCEPNSWWIVNVLLQFVAIFFSKLHPLLHISTSLVFPFIASIKVFTDSIFPASDWK